MIKKRTSQGYRISILKRLTGLVRNRKYVEALSLLLSDEFFEAGLRMTAYDREVTMSSAHRIMAPIWKEAIAAHTARAKWSAEQVAKLRGIAARYGLQPGLDKELARKMELPLVAVTVARYRYVGRIRAPQPSRKIRVRGFHEPKTYGKGSQGVRVSG